MGLDRGDVGPTDVGQQTCWVTTALGNKYFCKRTLAIGQQARLKLEGKKRIGTHCLYHRHFIDKQIALNAPILDTN